MTSATVARLTHSWLDDGHALLAGALFVALGLTMFAHAGLLTGGVAGVAFLVSYATGWSLALCFFGFSLPFFWLSWRRLGPAFTLKSLVAVTLVSLCTALAPKVVRFELLNPWVASVLGGFLIGFGLLALLRPWVCSHCFFKMRCGSKRPCARRETRPGYAPGKASQRRAWPFWPQPEGNGLKTAPLVVALLGQTPGLAVVARLD